ncbi:MAG: type III PLP-dependent enzyme [Lentisphaerae bacterium]|nr:type III PLP-dependent enzyme [Lentisphaerota bacterium]MCP4102282.1 type III PLP-dependent enzyme [Lentisphaerota bacterium]
MKISSEEYYSDSEWKLFKQEAAKYQTPFLLVNLDIVKKSYQEVEKFFPFSDVYYAVKANPASEIITLLDSLGCNFDIASIYEMESVLACGVKPDKISFGNTIKKLSDIRLAYSKGLRLFATDSEDDLRSIAAAAPGSNIYVRILTEGTATADWPLSRKFGCHPDMATDLLLLARKLKLNPYGVSFHVGSQQRDVGTWDTAISITKYIFDYMADEGINLEMINLGGGLPANYISQTNPLEVYASEIKRYLEEDFGENMPRIIMEPGRSLVGNAGVLISEVVTVARKSRVAVDRWIFLDAGKFNGLVETWDECIKYPLVCEKADFTCEDGVLAGPTCDSQDIMYEHYRYRIPVNLCPGDRIYWLTAGAYTASYASVDFNGFPPLKTHFIGE